jgi:hypothetical protein
MTARGLYKPASRGNRGVAVAGGCFTGARARVGESLANAVGPAPKVESQAFPLKPRVERWFGTLLSICFFSLMLAP